MQTGCRVTVDSIDRSLNVAKSYQNVVLSLARPWWTATYRPDHFSGAGAGKAEGRPNASPNAMFSPWLSFLREVVTALVLLSIHRLLNLGSLYMEDGEPIDKRSKATFCVFSNRREAAAEVMAAVQEEYHAQMAA